MPTPNESQERESIERFESPSSAQHQLSQTITSAKYQLDIISDHLALFHANDITEAISRFVRRHRTLKARILIKDSRPLRGQSHSLIALAQRLPSKVHVRVISEEALPFKPSYCLADTKLTYFDSEADSTGFSGIDRARVRQYRETFEHLWQNQSLVDPDLTQLCL